MSKVKEISEEKYKVLSELGMLTMWDMEPFYSRRQIEHIFTRNTSRFVSYSEYLKHKEAISLHKEHRFYTLVEDSAERSEDE